MQTGEVRPANDPRVHLAGIRATGTEWRTFLKIPQLKVLLDYFIQYRRGVESTIERYVDIVAWDPIELPARANDTLGDSMRSLRCISSPAIVDDFGFPSQERTH